MVYAKWSDQNDLASLVQSIDPKGEIEKSGLPMGYEENKLLVNQTNAHTLVIGSAGSGKTQSVLLPTAKMAMKAGESFLVHDVGGELYAELASKLEEKGYQTILIHCNGNEVKDHWNPFSLAYNLYQQGNRDDAVTLVEEIAYYLFREAKVNPNEDPFWINTTISYFIGLVFYLFETSREEVTLKKIYELSLDGMKKSEGKEHSKMIEILNQQPQDSLIYITLSGTVMAPPDTRGSILAVFNQKMRLFISREKFSEMISHSDFDIKNIGITKTAIFVTSRGDNKSFSGSFIPLLVHQIIYSIKEYGKKDKTFNIFLDEFEKIVPMKDITSVLTNTRPLNIKFYLFIRSYLDLTNTYGKEEQELLKLGIGNIVYLLANDFYTLNEISEMCGKVNEKDPLITIEELRTLKNFEAVILVPRYMPIKTELLPDYKISW